MEPINEMDVAEFKVEMRQLYREIGFEASLRCLAEILKSAEILTEVICEEKGVEPK